jgi:predicted O-methyltransferase YrrM
MDDSLPSFLALHYQNVRRMETRSTIRTRYYCFEKYESAEYSSGVEGQVATQLMMMYRKAVRKVAPLILELGTGKGQSTTVLLQACEEKDGRLVSVDIVDCSQVSDSKRWQFVQSDSTDVELILYKAPYLKEGIDILYIDSFHRKEHVNAELTGWYPYMNEKAWIFFDDVDSNPYRKGHRKDKFQTELSCNEIHDYVKDFFYANEDSLRLSIMYGSTGLACLYKLSPQGAMPQEAKRIVHRRKTILNMMRYSPRSIFSRGHVRGGSCTH